MNDHPGFVALKRIWNVFVLGVLVLASVLTVLATSTPTLPAVLPLGLAMAVGAGAVVTVIGMDRVFAASPPEDDDTAIRQFRGRLVVQAVIAAVTVLLCTMIAFAFGPRWTITVGAVAALMALLMVRPTRARLARFDAAWGRTERDVSLQRALRRTP